LIFNKHVTDVHAVMQTDNIKHRKISDEKYPISQFRLSKLIGNNFSTSCTNLVTFGSVIGYILEPMTLECAHSMHRSFYWPGKG